jgi:methylated-DNA-[protein]-cysteine S-methyltransferase
MPATRPPTEFENRVYQAIRTIPPGKVCTYGELARHLACRSPRAVGQALRRNPFAPATPCHRVVGGKLLPGGFHGMTSGPAVHEKIQLLRAEGVSFSNNGRIDSSCIHHFPS